MILLFVPECAMLLDKYFFFLKRNSRYGVWHCTSLETINTASTDFIICSVLPCRYLIQHKNGKSHAVSSEFGCAVATDVASTKIADGVSCTKNSKV
jgi:hypothetical protein